jgi:phenylalanine ammonia-lyase
MDSMRYLIGLLAKHIDAQIALLMTPEFSHGLSASLVGNTAGAANVGLKSVQLGGNQMMPLIGYYGQSVADRFPTHAEQFNQNINSQAMSSANLAREQLEVLEHYLALALLCAIQAVELRASQVAASYDARAVLSAGTRPLYEAARTAAAGPPDAARPLHWNDLDELIQPKVEGLLADIATQGGVLRAVSGVTASLRESSP